MNSAIKLGVSAVIIAAVIVTSNTNINWLSLSGLTNANNNSQTQNSTDEDLSLDVGFFPNLNHAQAIIGFENGDFAKTVASSDSSRNITIKQHVFSSGPSAIEALYAGQIDIAYVNPNSIIDGFILSGGDGFKIISGVSSGGASFIVRNDSGIESAKDLGGKKFASPQLGNAQDVALRKYLLDNGFKTTDKSGNVTLMNMKPAEILSKFGDKEIDGAWVPEPIAAILIKQYQGKLLVDERNLWPTKQFASSAIIVSKDYLEKYPGIIKKFLEAHVNETNWLKQRLSNNNGSENLDEVITAFNKGLTKITGKSYPESQLKDALSRIDFTVDPLSNSLQTMANDSRNFGFISLGPNWNTDFQKIYDLNILNQILSESGENPVK